MATAHEEFEFVGPWLGPVGIVAGLPCVCYLLVFFCSGGECLELFPFKAPEIHFSISNTYSHAGLLVFLGWIAYVVLLHLILPGRIMEGVKLANGTRLTYKMNGKTMSATCVMLGLALALICHRIPSVWVRTEHRARGLELQQGMRLTFVTQSRSFYCAGCDVDLGWIPGILHKGTGPGLDARKLLTAPIRVGVVLVFPFPLSLCHVLLQGRITGIRR